MADCDLSRYRIMASYVLTGGEVQGGRGEGRGLGVSGSSVASH